MARLGLGTYRTRDIVQAAEAAIKMGVDWIDTAPNYQRGKAEYLLAPVLAAYPHVKVSTKMGFLSEQCQAEAVESGLLSKSAARKGHSLEPCFLVWQAARSKMALGRAPDVTFVHNPEHGSPKPRKLEERVREAFRTLEACCQRGLTRGYGVAAWSALHDGSLTVARLLDLAREAGGPSHRLQAIQLPLSLVHLGPLADTLTQRGVLADAQAAGLNVYASAPLHGGELARIITPTVAERLLPGATPLELLLGMVASAPGVTRILLSASTGQHWSTAAQSVLRPPLNGTELRRILDAFPA
ncbi:aldo/keto reductase [Streptomyces sp. NPDC088554]|uniref:aldo/keto reductase n=1 Tax=Streptomyces sp. NPDC088554 TaxID=3365865 RepID=UPI003814D291